MPERSRRFETQTSDEEDRTYLTVEDAQGYLALAQFGVVEFHSWGCRCERLERPDRVVFDLDPGEGIAWREVVEAAVHVRDVLAALGLVPSPRPPAARACMSSCRSSRELDWKAVHAATGEIAGGSRRRRRTPSPR